MLPASHKELQRALEREARTHAKRQAELDRAGRSEQAGAPGTDPGDPAPHND